MSKKALNLEKNTNMIDYENKIKDIVNLYKGKDTGVLLANKEEIRKSLCEAEETKKSLVELVSSYVDYKIAPLEELGEKVDEAERHKRMVKAMGYFKNEHGRHFDDLRTAWDAMFDESWLQQPVRTGGGKLIDEAVEKYLVNLQDAKTTSEK